MMKSFNKNIIVIFRKKNRIMSAKVIASPRAWIDLANAHITIVHPFSKRTTAHDRKHSVQTIPHRGQDDPKSPDFP